MSTRPTPPFKGPLHPVDQARLDIITRVAAEHAAREWHAPGAAERRAGRINELQRAPAYLDGKHPGHAAAVAAVTRAYADAYPDHGNRPPVPASAAVSGGANNAAQLARVRELQARPAYLDRNHPHHEATKKALTWAYIAAYPEAPAAPPDGAPQGATPA